MSLSILNNISALQAENQLSITTAAANKSLQQLSSGSRINSGSDDAAGLAISDGLNANVAALNQSSLNATNAVGSLQTADGALAQVTALLNRSVTLATEASNTGLSSAQSTAINNEFQALLTQIGNIGTSTNFNGTAVFGSTVSAFTSDGTTNGTVSIGGAVAALTTTSLGLNASTLATSSGAQAALTVITAAISTVSAQRGTLGATVEQLQAASTVDTNESQNLVSASSNITSADISTVVANDTKYSILQQTGISALQQANQQAQTVLKLLQ
ncbi:flagellin [Granulicella tundricola]|uniref:Flagellin n=1 Tax=Granulicella tundricola (strain ATCC BAA-1859 / DSM 23138 / MP5ACTX9) TaxID=1198114 RepID=E8X611_GRATM|nr:flagellin [Granulicella tundricola]ADW70895.1 flagellin domain protein [Granulicella tundricola MP5ACTX9]